MLDPSDHQLRIQETLLPEIVYGYRNRNNTMDFEQTHRGRAASDILREKTPAVSKTFFDAAATPPLRRRCGAAAAPPRTVPERRVSQVHDVEAVAGRARQLWQVLLPGAEDTSRSTRTSCCVLAADVASGPTPQKSSKTGSVSANEVSRRRYETFNLTMVMRVPQADVLYTPTASEVFKDAWVKYLAIFVVVKYLLEYFCSFVAYNQLVDTTMRVETAADKDGVRATKL